MKSLQRLSLVGTHCKYHIWATHKWHFCKSFLYLSLNYKWISCSLTVTELNWNYFNFRETFVFVWVSVCVGGGGGVCVFAISYIHYHIFVQSLNCQAWDLNANRKGFKPIQHIFLVVLIIILLAISIYGVWIQISKKENHLSLI